MRGSRAIQQGQFFASVVMSLLYVLLSLIQMLSFTVEVEQELFETGSRTHVFFNGVFKFRARGNYIRLKEGYGPKIFIKLGLKKYVNYDWRTLSLVFG